MRTTDLFEYQVEDVNFESLGFWEFQSKPKPMQLIERICMNLEEENKYKFYVVYSENIDDGETLIVEELTEKEFDKMNNGDEFLTVENDSLDDEYGG